MTAYIYRCPSFPEHSSVETQDREAFPFCDPCWDVYPCGGTIMVRDYRAEGVSATGMVALKQERELNFKERAHDVLPSNDDFAGPGDPDGKKGMRAWRDSVVPYKGHGDREANTKPFWPGEVERKVL